MSLKLIKSKIRATQRTGKVAKAMEAVSAVKMRKSQERALVGRPYARAALRILSHLQGRIVGDAHPLMRASEATGVCVVVITSDKGLAGNLNNAVLKAVHKEIDGLPKEQVSLVCLGRKGYDHFRSRGYNVLLHHIHISDEVSLTEMEEIMRVATDAFLRKEAGRVVVAYQNFISTFYQEARVRQVLPLDTQTLARVVEDITPQQGKYAETQEEVSGSPYTIEPSDEVVLDSVLPRLIEIMLYHAMLEHKASEHSARMVAMKNATDKAKEVTKTLKLRFNKERQAVITREVSEITGGIEAMKE